MIAQEDGPFDIFVKFRNSLGVRYSQANLPYGQNWISRGIICVWCVSFWASLVIVGSWEYSQDFWPIMTFTTIASFVVNWFAVGSVAIAIDKVIAKQ
jgi:hypothetical protein